jgi:hypothetical protein
MAIWSQRTVNETEKRKAAVLKMSGQLLKDRDSCLFPMPTSTPQTDWPFAVTLH